MTTHMQHPWLVIFAGLFLATASAYPAGADEEEYFKALEVGRSAWRLIKARGPHPAAPEDVAAASEMLAGVSTDAGCPAYRVIELLRLRLDVQAGRTEKAQDGFLKLAESPGVAPECFMVLRSLVADDPRTRREMEDCIALVLPMSRWSRVRNMSASVFWADINPPAPSIPRADPDNLCRIAALFCTGQFPVEAWMASVEAAYATAPSWIGSEWRSGTWFCPETAFLWRNAAENARKAGEEVLAYDYLTKFAIFGSEAQFDEAKQIAGRWKAGKPQGEEPEIPRAERQKALKETLRLYAELNAHPRALELIEKHGDWFDDPDDLYTQYSDQWKAIVKSYSRTTKHIILFGVNVTGDMDPATIRIPPPCQPENTKEAKAKAIETLKARR